MWKKIKNFENYSISELGHIINNQTQKNKRPFLGKRGYFVIDLYSKNKRKNIKIHRLVAISFIKNPQNKATVNHINGDKSDNSVKNLEWNTYKENINNARKMGLIKKTQNCKLDLSKANNIRVMFLTGRSLKELSDLFSVTKATISRIVNDKIWRNENN